MRHPRTLHLLAAAAMVLSACGGDDATDDPPADAGEPTDADAPADEAAGDEVAVAIRDEDGRRFEPADVTVAAGGSVTWTHEGGLPHTVTATDGSFDSGNLDGGATFSFTAEEPGTIDYACSIHSDMTGTVTVS